VFLLPVLLRLEWLTTEVVSFIIEIHDIHRTPIHIYVRMLKSINIMFTDGPWLKHASYGLVMLIRKSRCM
jgi:hypothetical protein